MSDLGDLVKRELDHRNCGQGYNPDIETYTPWHGLRKYKIMYVDEILGADTGAIFHTSKEIQVKKRAGIVKVSGTLYHETQHADFLPLEIILSLIFTPAISQFLVATYSSGNNLWKDFLMSIPISLFCAIIAADLISEVYADFRKGVKFDW